MLSRLDDYPIHQTPEPVAHSLNGSLNQYDRYFFNGFTRDGSLYFGVALGLYPNRRVMDAAISVVRDGVEISCIASRQAPLEPTDTHVGPIRVSIDEPLRTFTITVGPNESGIEGQVTFTARTIAVEEPRFTYHQGATVTFDYTRLTQWGTWSGRLTVDGETLTISPGEVLGVRDRSWGIRPVGQQPPGPGGFSQFFWLWAPLHFDDCCVHFDVNETGEGRQWHSFGAVIPLLSSPSDALTDTGGIAPRMERVSHEIRWQPGTRRAAEATIHMEPFAGDPVEVHLEPMATFQMLGLGYLNPEWGHGHWKGEEAVHAERWVLSELDPLNPFYVHIQHIVRATMGDRVGVGVFEQLVIGPHAPSGFTELLDGAK